MIIVKTSVWQYLGIVLFILGSSSIFKILMKTFEHNGKEISKNVVKLDLEQNINLWCIIILSTYVQRKQIFDNFMKYCSCNLYLVITRLMHGFKTTGWLQGHLILSSFPD